MIEWCMLENRSKYGHHKDTCLEMIGLCAPNMLIHPNLNSQHNRGDLHDN